MFSIPRTCCFAAALLIGGLSSAQESPVASAPPSVQRVFNAASHVVVGVPRDFEWGELPIGQPGFRFVIDVSRSWKGETTSTLEAQISDFVYTQSLGCALYPLEREEKLFYLFGASPHLVDCDELEEVGWLGPPAWNNPNPRWAPLDERVHDAVRAGDVDRLRGLIDAGSSVIGRDSLHKTTPLIEAVELGHLELVDTLLAAGVDANAGRNWQTPLRAAATRGDLSIAKRLLDAGATFDPGALSGATEVSHTAMEQLLLDAFPGERHAPANEKTLIGAIRDRDVALVKLLLEGEVPVSQQVWERAAETGDARLLRALAEIDPEDRRFQEGDIVVAACVAESDSALEWLVERGVAFDVHGRGGSPLYQVLQKGWFDRAVRLLDAGADPNFAEDDRRTPLSGAVHGGAELVELLLSRGADARNDSTPLAIAAGSGKDEVVELLLAAGADVNRAAPSGILYLTTPLIEACRKGNLGVARKLLDAGAKTSVTAASGETPLDAALSSGERALVDLLLERGADPKLGRPLESAMAGGLFELVEPLIERGAIASREALGRAALIGHEPTVHQLLVAGADPSALSELDGQALASAAHQNSWALVERLLDAGVSVDPPQPHVPGVLTLASRSGRIALVGRLLEMGADPNRGKTTEMNPLTVAMCSNHVEVAEALLEHGADVRRRLASENTVGAHGLFCAVKRGSLDGVRLILEHGVDVNERRYGRNSDQHVTALVLAVGEFLDHPVDPERNAEPLEIVRTLVDAGASVDVEILPGQTLLQLLEPTEHLLSLLRGDRPPKN